jgi:hypothetical protein
VRQQTRWNWGVALLRVGFTAARTNVEARLGSLTDVLYTNAIVEEIARLGDEVTNAVRAAELSVRVPPA